MDIKKIEEALYSEEFAPYLQILKEEYWKKATKNKRIEFFAKLHELMASIDESLPIEFDKDDLEALGFPGQAFFCDDEIILVDPKYFTKESNPYQLFASYMFEVGLFKRLICEFKNVDTDEEEKRNFVNTIMSYFGDWSNFYDRKSSKFYVQPITYSSYEEAGNICYNLLKYMHKNHGMDCYIGNYLSGIMLLSFSGDKNKELVEQEYAIMEKRFNEEIPKEKEVLEKVAVFMADYIDRLGDLEDEDFYGLLNEKLFFNFEEPLKEELLKEFVRRALKGYDDVEQLVSDIYIGESEYGRMVVVDGSGYLCDGVSANEISCILPIIMKYKYANNLFFEINNQELVAEARKCYEYFDHIEDVDYKEYLMDAYATNELACNVYDYYHKLITDSISKSKFLNNGDALIKHYVFSKQEIYLKFVYDMCYEQVKKEQFESLEKQFLKITGGKR